MNRAEILEKFANVVAENSVKARRLLQKLDYKNDPILLQHIAQTYLDEARFEDDGTPRETLKWSKLQAAERYAIKAFKLSPDCLYVLSTMGSLRRSLAQKDVAIFCFERIIEVGANGGVSNQCEINDEMVNELINDAKFELYRLYHEDNPKLSEKYLTMYKKGLEKGVNTIYKPLKKYLLK